MENGEPIRKFSEAEIKEEHRRIRHLRRLVDFSMALIAQSPMSLDEARQIVQAVRGQAMGFFPGKRKLSNSCTLHVSDGLLRKNSA